MFINKIINELQAQLMGYDWFSKKILLSKESHNTLIVYVNKMNYQILSSIPSETYGFHIVAHFIQSIEDTYQAKTPSSLAYKMFDRVIDLHLN